MSQKKKDLIKKRNIVIAIKMEKEDILRMLDASREYHFLAKEDKEELDLFNELLEVSSKNDVVNNLAATLLQLYFLQKKMEKIEEYEICHQIQLLVEWEIQEADRLVRTYHEDFLTDDFKIEAKRGAQEQIILNYDIWIEMI